MKLKDLPLFWKKDTFSRLQEGRSWGGRMEGCLNGGGDFRHTWWGAGGALDTHMKHFLPPKTRFFDFDVCLGMKGGRPPILRSGAASVCLLSMKFVLGASRLGFVYF